MSKKVKKGGLIGSSGFYMAEDQKRFQQLQRMTQQYDALILEIMAKKNNLQRAKKRKLTLKAEVGFLRQRYEYLIGIRSPTPPLEQYPRQTQVPKTRREALPMERSYRERERSYRDREATLPHPAPVIDLNQISTDEEEMEAQNVVVPLIIEKNPIKFSINRGSKLPLALCQNNVTGEEENKIQYVVEPTRVEKNQMKFAISKSGKPPLPPRRSNVKLSTDVKLSVCRDVGKGSSQTEKRKISWQDHVALRV